MKNYENGRFNVTSADGRLIGRIDGDEFIRDHQARLMYRIDGDEVYKMDGSFFRGVKFWGSTHSRRNIFSHY